MMWSVMPMYLLCYKDDEPVKQTISVIDHQEEVDFIVSYSFNLVEKI